MSVSRHSEAFHDGVCPVFDVITPPFLWSLGLFFTSTLSRDVNYN